MTLLGDSFVDDFPVGLIIVVIVVIGWVINAVTSAAKERAARNQLRVPRIPPAPQHHPAKRRKVVVAPPPIPRVPPVTAQKQRQRKPEKVRQQPILQKATPEPTPPPSTVARPRIRLNAGNVRAAFVLSEILRPPMALRPPDEDRG